MPKIISSYVKYIDGLTSIIGRITMYLVFVLMGILVIFLPLRKKSHL